MLLQETLDFTPTITEGENGRIRVEGLYQLYNCVNANKRIYERRLWENLLKKQSPYMQKLEARRALGELGHPSEGKTRLSEVSHLITDTWLDDKPSKGCIVCDRGGNPQHGHIFCKEEILDTPQGKTLGALLRAGCQLGVSSRGNGSVRQEGDHSIVNDDYKLETFDHVLDPSTPGAYPSMVSESLVNVIENLIKPQCPPAELQGYRNILTGMVDGIVEDGIRESARSLVETLDVRLANMEVGSTSVQVPASMPESESPKPVEATPSTPEESGETGNKTQPDDVEERMATVDKNHPEVRSLAAELAQEGLQMAQEDFDAKFAEACSTIDQLRNELHVAEQKYAASEELGNELLSQVKELQIKSQSFQEHIDGEYSIVEKYETAKKVIDELVDRVRKLKYAEARSIASEQLLSEVVARVKRDRLSGHIEALISNLDMPESRARQLRPVLSEARSIAEANVRFASLQSFLTEQVSGEPMKPVRTEGALPTPNRGGQIMEEQTALLGDPNEGAGQVTEEQQITRQLVRRLSRQHAA